MIAQEVLDYLEKNDLLESDSQEAIEAVLQSKGRVIGDWDGNNDIHFRMYMFPDKSHIAFGHRYEGEILANGQYKLNLKYPGEWGSNDFPLWFPSAQREDVKKRFSDIEIWEGEKECSGQVSQLSLL